MKRNKEIKRGDKIWLYCPCLDENSYYPVLRVKKNGTLVEVVVEGHDYIKDCGYEITMYGHASSSILSGFDKKFRKGDISYTCDYKLINGLTQRYNYDQKYIDAGKALLKIAKFFKNE